jgi:hypothetical protein
MTESVKPTHYLGKQGVLCWAKNPQFTTKHVKMVTCEFCKAILRR